MEKYWKRCCYNGTGIPACILIFNRNKAEGRKGNVLFIAAEDEYQEGKNQNTLRDDDIKKIVDAFDAYIDVEKYARVVSLEEINENNYNLNITRYVDKSEEEEPVDLSAVLKDLKGLEVKQSDIKRKLYGYLQELGIGEV